MVGFREALVIAYISLLLSYMSYASDTSATPTSVSKRISNSPSTEKPATNPTSRDKDSPGQSGNTTRTPSTPPAQSPGPAINASNAAVDTPTTLKPTASTKNSSVNTESGGATTHPDATTLLNKPDNQNYETSNNSGATTLKSTTPLISSTLKNGSVTTKNKIFTTQKPDNTLVSDKKTNTTQNKSNTSTTTQKPSVASTQTPNKTSNGSQKPDKTTVATQKPETQSVSASKPVKTSMSTSTEVPTQKPDNTSLSTQKPENTTVSTQKSNNTSVPTQKPENTSVSTQKPNNTSVPTQKPDNTSVTTQKLNNTSVPTQKPESTSVSTQKPNDTSVHTAKSESTSVTTQKLENTSVSTLKPDNTSVPTQKPDNTTVSTLKPDTTTISAQKPNTTVPGKPSTTEASTQKADNTSVTTTQKMIITSSKKPASFPPRDEFVYINEIMVDRNGGFQKVELQLSKQFDIAHYAMVMVDGKTNKDMSVVYLKDMVLQKNGLLVITFNSSQTSPSMKDNGTGVAIYDTRQMSLKGDWTVSEAGLVDALVIGKTYTGVSEHLTNTLTPGVNPFILDPNKYGMSRTISRCSSEQLRNTDMFALINPSFGTVNKKKCQERLSASSDFAIKIKSINCSVLEDNSYPVSKYDLTQKKLIHYIVKSVNAKCQCGVTWMHIVDPVVHCCDGASLDMRFVAPNKEQLNELKDNYRKFLKETHHVNVANHLYQIDNNCYENCCGVRKHPKPQAVDDTAKNVKVTVAVIVSCLIVFMIVVIIVIMYMKRKKRAVYQFRMSRLDEEDDLVIDGPEHEDFVGGQEATFDVYPR